MTKLPQMDTPEPPPPVDPPPPMAPPAAQPPSKLRTYITFAVLAAVVAVIVFFVSQNKDAGDLAVGTCFDRPSTNQDFSTVATHPCTEAHDAEVVLVSEYTSGDAFPISLTLDNYMDDTCTPAAILYVGEDNPLLDSLRIGLFSPNREGWDGGDRTFTCYVLDADLGKLTQSVKAGAAAS